MHRMKISEDSAEHATRSQGDIVGRLGAREEQAIALERDNQNLAEQVRRMSQELSELQVERVAILDERDALRANLRVVDEERANAIHQAS